MIEKKLQLKALNLGFLETPFSLLANYCALVLTGNFYEHYLMLSSENKITVFFFWRQNDVAASCLAFCGIQTI